MRSFFSDNGAGLCPEALDALIEANDGSHVSAYGTDRYTENAQTQFRRIFGTQSQTQLVATGTAANTLAIASLTDPWNYVLCHKHSHWTCDESTAPERITQCRTRTLETDATRIVPEDLRRGLYDRGDIHQPQPGVLTLSNPTELGVLYTPKQTRSLCDAAHALGFAVHVDGARFANAVAALGCDPRALTCDAGVDALSFGGTKNGLAFGEAVIFFPQGDGAVFEQACRRFPYHRKSTGHLLSKHRFIAAPFAATLANDAWLRHAKHANTLATRLAEGLTALGLSPRFPCESNAVFVSLPATLDAALRAGGDRYYAFGEPNWNLFRLMCSFDSQPEEVDRLLALARIHLSRSDS